PDMPSAPTAARGRNRPRMSTVWSGGENTRAFSMSSARRWGRSGGGGVGGGAGGGADDGGGFDAADGDPLVVLDLTQRRPDDVGEPHGCGPLAGWFDAGQHQQRFGVAAHAGGEVVEAEQVGEGVGVGFVGFELGDEVELA